jgi:Holliday junction DNA helicase RuvA
MIAYLEGTLLKAGEDRILLLVDHVGYEVLLPSYLMERVREQRPAEPLALHIYHQQTERQPKPVLIGFLQEEEKEFFQLFLSVEDIGPMKAVKAMTLPVGEIARAIESKDIAILKTLKGIGNRTAQKMVATLSGKMEKFALPAEIPTARPESDPELIDAVVEVLISQLGYKATDARRMVAEALQRNPSARKPEELFDEVLRGQLPGR